MKYLMNFLILILGIWLSSSFAFATPSDNASSIVGEAKIKDVLQTLQAIPPSNAANPNEKYTKDTATNIKNMPEIWFACKSSEECQRINIGCGASSISTNYKYVSDATNVLCKTSQYPQNCPAAGCLTSAPDNTIAVCENNRCILESSNR